MEKRILFSTIECWSSYNSATTANTFMNLFKSYDSRNMASIYFRDDIPSTDRCSVFFEISETAIIKSHYKLGIQTGIVYYGKNIVISEKKKEHILKSNKRYKIFGPKRNYFFVELREFLWFTGKWKTRELDNFLDEFKPEIIIFGMEGYRYFNHINRYIIKKTGAKAVGFFWDDNFTYKQHSKTPGFIVHRLLQRISLKKTAKMCSAFFAISPKTKREADSFFGINCEVITKPVDNIEGLNDNKELFEKQKIKVVYTGNLKIGRLNTLEVISSVLLNNPDLETRFIFDIYSATDIPDAIRAKLSKSIHLCGTIPLQEVSKVQKSADMLLLIEDITGENQHTARLSFSTKITDYLCQGKCILAIGNTDIASMEYFKSENCALCASDIVSIEEKLRLVLDSPEILLIMGKNALNVARKNHSREIIEKRMYEVLRRI